MVVEKIKLNDGHEMPVYGLGTMFVSSFDDKTVKENHKTRFA